MLIVCAVGTIAAVAAATASATNCVAKEEEKGRVCLFLSATELELLEAATFSLLQEEGSPRKFEVDFTPTLAIECKGGSGTAGVFVEAIEGATETYSGCELTGVNKTACRLESGEIKTEQINALGSQQTELEGSVEGLRLALLFKPATTDDAFATFTIESTSGHTCADAQEDGKIKGEQSCFFLEPIETDEVEHLLECPASGSELTFAGNTATYEAEDSVLMVTPVADNSWSIVRGE
jgi:hypothetical protein